MMTKKLPSAKDWQARQERYEYLINKVKEGDFLVRDGKLFKTYEKIGRGAKTRLDSPKEVGKKERNGYITYGFRYKGKPVTIMVHRLIYAVENDLNTLDPELVINHKNGVKDDNRPSNLELVTHKENIAHSLDTGLKNIENNNTTKLTWEDVDQIRELFKEGYRSNREIGDMFGVCKCTIRNIRNGKSWVRGREAYEERKTASGE